MGGLCKFRRRSVGGKKRNNKMVVYGLRLYALFNPLAAAHFLTPAPTAPAAPGKRMRGRRASAEQNVRAGWSWYDFGVRGHTQNDGPDLPRRKAEVVNTAGPQHARGCRGGSKPTNSPPPGPATPWPGQPSGRPDWRASWQERHGRGG